MPTPEALARRVAELEAELAAARRTIDVLADRVERPPVAADADRFALYKTITTLQSVARSQQEAAERSAEHARVLVEASPDAILTLDAHERVLSGNPAASRLLGRGDGELVGTPLSGLLARESAAALTSLLWAGFRGVGESDLDLEDGRRVSFSVASLADDRTLLVLRDVTRNHQIEQEGLRTRRLTSIGKLASGLLQEITTPLSIVRGRTNLLVSRLSDDPALARQAQTIDEHCRRIASVVQNLQAYAAPRPLARAWHPVRDVLAEVERSGGRKVGRLRLETEVEPPALEVYADREQLTQMLCNLLGHVAERASGGSARVTMRVTAGKTAGSARFEVLDEHGVLPAAVLDELRSPYADGGRQFDPAAGLSLAIAWAICQDHGGFLTADVREPEGIAYRVVLPPPPEVVAAPEEDAAGHMSILVVDDDQLLCETVSWMLAEEGHTISAVSTGEEALVRLTRQRFDALIVDIGLPGMSGVELVAAVRRRTPKLAGRVLVTSGLLHSPGEGEAYLQKPFTRVQLLGALARLFEDPSAGLGPDAPGPAAPPGRPSLGGARAFSENDNSG
jgi:nitrogen-specific signal transduction histidine kinase